ncbi:MAG: hypothetical protein ACFB3T_10300 [Geminicoccaceae bacterium]
MSSTLMRLTVASGVALAALTPATMTAPAHAAPAPALYNQCSRV